MTRHRQFIAADRLAHGLPVHHLPFLLWRTSPRLPSQISDGLVRDCESQSWVGSRTRPESRTCPRPRSAYRSVRTFDRLRIERPAACSVSLVIYTEQREAGCYTSLYCKLHIRRDDRLKKAVPADAECARLLVQTGRARGRSQNDALTRTGREAAKRLNGSIAWSSRWC